MEEETADLAQTYSTAADEWEHDRDSLVWQEAVGDGLE